MKQEKAVFQGEKWLHWSGSGTERYLRLIIRLDWKNTVQKQDSLLRAQILMCGKALTIPRSMKMVMKKENQMALQGKFMPIVCHQSRKKNGCVM